MPRAASSPHCRCTLRCRGSVSRRRWSSCRRCAVPPPTWRRRSTGDAMTILVLNSGSSSIKFATYERGERPTEVVERLRGQVSGLPDAPVLSWRAADGSRDERPLSQGTDARGALEAVLQRIGEAGAHATIDAIG